MTQFLLALCGIPASGKTSLAREILRATSSQEEVRLVSTDSWRNHEYYSEFRPEKEQEVRKKALESTRSFLQRGWSVIHDDTNYYSSMRHELFSLAEEVECRFGVVYVNTPLDIALEWNRKRENIIPPDVVSRIHEKFDVPGSKYAWDRSLYEMDLSKKSIEESVKDLMVVLDKLPPITPKDVSKAGMKERYDTATREIVKEFLAQEQTCRNNSEVSQIRREILREALEQDWSLEETRKRRWKKLTSLIIGVAK